MKRKTNPGLLGGLDPLVDQRVSSSDELHMWWGEWNRAQSFLGQDWLCQNSLIYLFQFQCLFSLQMDEFLIVGMESEVKLPKVQFSIPQNSHPWRKMCSFSKSDFPSLWLANSSSCHWLHRDAYTAEILSVWWASESPGELPNHEFSGPVLRKSNSVGLHGNF